MAKLDLSDPLVRLMADQNHVPAEHWGVEEDEDGEPILTNGKPQVVLIEVACETCGSAWPCPTRVELGITGDTIGAFEWQGKTYHTIPNEDGAYAIVDGVIYPLELLEEEEDESDEELS